jgi:hypothetical protein
MLQQMDDIKYNRAIHMMTDEWEIYRFGMKTFPRMLSMLE